MQDAIGRPALPQPAPGETAPVAQRYTVVKTKQQKPGYWEGIGAPLRVSDDGRMAVKHIDGAPSNSPDYQVFYATADLIEASSQALAQTDSAFTIAAGGSTLTGRAPGDKHAPVRTLVDAVTRNTDLARIGKGEQTFNACSANLSNFLGVLRSMPDDPSLLEQRRDVEIRLEGALDHDRKSVLIGEDLGLAMIQARSIVTGQDTQSGARAAYNGMKESLRKQISVQYGVNENALPEVGQGFGIITGGTGGGMGHFAPVVAVSGADRVTLENDVGQTEGSEVHGGHKVNPNFYFRMFGPVKEHWYGNEDQTFWGEARKHESDDYGSRPLVVTLGSRPKAPPAEDD